MNRNDILAINAKLGTNFDPNSQVMAMDAYTPGTPQTVANAGIPAMLTTWLSPKWIEYVTAPMKIAQAVSERQLGDRTTTNVEFPTYELVGDAGSYGDFNDNGVADTNENYEFRQPYSYQTNIIIGEIAQERAAVARFDLVDRKVQSAQFILNRIQNEIYLNGVAGLRNYGMLNDPDLLPDLVGINWYSATAEQVFAEIQKVYSQLVVQSKGLVDLSSPMTLLLSPLIETALARVNSFGISVYDLLKKTFTGLKIVSIPEYSTTSGEKMQLILDSYNGNPVAELGFVDKLRVHAVEIKTSSFLQKRSQSTLGAIIYYPIFISNYLGQYSTP